MPYKSSSRGGARPRLVALHTAEGARTAASLGAFFQRPDVQASSHVGIDAGRTLRYVSDERAAWTLRSGNPISLNAEICGFARWARAQWLSTGTVDGCVNPRAMVRRAAAWALASCRRWKIPIRLLVPAQVRAMAGVIDHYDWTLGAKDGSHTDVGDGFPWDVFLADIRELAGDQDQEDDELSAAAEQMIKELHAAYRVGVAKRHAAGPMMLLIREGALNSRVLLGRIAGLEEALAAKAGVDLDAVRQAAEQGARAGAEAEMDEALEELQRQVEEAMKP